MSVMQSSEKVTHGCAVDRVGKVRIIHVFDEVTLRTADRLVAIVDRVASETSGNVVLSLLESRDVERAAVDTLLRRTLPLHGRLTLVAPPALTTRYAYAAAVRNAECFGEVFG